MTKSLHRLTYILMVACIFSGAQTSEKSVYDYNAAFGHGFYTNNGTQTRSASGKPGHAYWQNSADYFIQVSLDDQSKKITGTETITYVNNSPDELNFLWLQLDQNLFKKDSRGNAIIPLNGSRNGAKGQDFDGGYDISKVRLSHTPPGKKSKKKSKAKDLTTNANYEITDTRMKIKLSKPLTANGGEIKINIDFSLVQLIEFLSFIWFIEWALI